ncbi:aspartate/glutamate racemase family protein [Oceanobacillus longus]|uniref:Aspartate/glutamate racemase family protein n=1 Tax=Oceanobacillus longus TaxID=930120 RepID=A0ABV8GZL2_9BACI
MPQEVIGILGGMGPAATVELFNRIVNNTAAKYDKEHVNTIIINDPQIPDRTEYILGEGESPIPKLKENIMKLHLAGAEYIAIPCMTAHTFISELQQSSPIPIINAIELIDRYLEETYPNVHTVGLLATTGSIKSGVYGKHLTKTNIITPDGMQQSRLMDIIYSKNGIKAGNTSPEIVNEINKILYELRKENIQAVIAGCTELGIVMNNTNMDMPVIDPITLLAKETVKLGNNYIKDENNDS